MKITQMNWQQVETWLKSDDRAILPLGSTEQHAGLSLSVDSILSEKVAVDAAEPLGVPVFPVVAYGITPYFRAFPGTITLSAETLLKLLGEIADSVYRMGFRKLALVNAHGGDLSLASKLGTGTTATIRLPLIDHRERIGGRLADLAAHLSAGR